jgi:hypothetical protein
MPFNQTRSREISRGTCLRHFAGRESIKSAVFDATTLTPEVINGQNYYRIPIGSFLSASVGHDPTKVKIFQGLGTNHNDEQTLTITGTPTGGTFTLSWSGLTTGNIKYNATAAEVAAALGALTNIGPLNVKTSGGALPATGVVITFEGLLGSKEQSLITANSAGLTGGASPTASVAHTTPGTTAEKIIGVFDGPDKDFFGTEEQDDEPIPVYFHSCVFDISKLQNWDLFGTAAMAALPTCDFF